MALRVFLRASTLLLAAALVAAVSPMSIAGASTASTALATYEDNVVSSRPIPARVDTPKSITDSKVPFLEFQESCAKKPGSPVCMLDEKDWANVLKRAKELGDMAAATNQVAMSIAERKNLPAKLSKSQVEKIFDHILVAAGHADPKYGKHLSAIKPAKEAIALWALNLATTLVDKNADTLDKVEAAGQVVPILGQGLSFFNSMRKNDVEGVIAATVSLGGLVAAIVCPPAGIAVSVAQAAYPLTKALLAAFAGNEGERDWVKQPPGTLQEFTTQTGRIQWEKTSPQSSIVANSTNEGKVNLSLVFSTGWPDEIVSDTPAVRYTLNPVKGKNVILDGFAVTDYTMKLETKESGNIKSTSAVVLAAGKQLVGECRKMIGYESDGLNQHFVGLGRACGPKEKIIVSPGKPAVFTMNLVLNPKYCAQHGKPVGCAWQKASLKVRVVPVGGKSINLSVPITITG